MAPQRQWSGRFVVSAIAFSFALTAAEALTRMTGIDQRLITPALYFVGADVGVHRVSADPVLHYELAPSTACRCEFKQRHYTVTIDDHGARYPTHPKAKAPGVFRILCVGGSTLYGGAINDDETIPAVLERQLNAIAGAGVRYEAWNFGTSAYTLRQAAHLARARLDDLTPDVILVQLHNDGRRAFLIPRSWNALDYPWSEILADPGLFEEQLALRPWLPNGVEAFVLRHSAFARAVDTVLPGFAPNSHGCALCDRMDRVEASGLSREAEARGIAVVYFAIPADRGHDKARDVFPTLAAERFIDLYQPNHAADFYEVHPTPATLEEFAQLLIDALRARGLVGKT